MASRRQGDGRCWCNSKREPSPIEIILKPLLMSHPERDGEGVGIEAARGIGQRCGPVDDRGLSLVPIAEPHAVRLRRGGTRLAL